MPPSFLVFAVPCCPVLCCVSCCGASTCCVFGCCSVLCCWLLLAASCAVSLVVSSCCGVCVEVCCPVLVCGAACCAPGCAAAPCRCASHRPALYCIVPCCVVSVVCCRCLLCCALGRCPSPWGPVPSPAVFCGVSRRCVRCAVFVLPWCVGECYCLPPCFVLCVSWGVVLRLLCPLGSVSCCGALCWCACIVLFMWSGLFVVPGAVVRCGVWCCFLWCSVVLCWVWLPAVVLWLRVSVSVPLSGRVACSPALCSVVLCCCVVLCCRALLSVCGAVCARLSFAVSCAAVLPYGAVLLDCAVRCPLLCVFPHLWKCF